MQNYSSDDLLRALKEHLIQHFDTGGQVAPTNSIGAPVAPSQQTGGILGIPGMLTAQNQYNAALAPTQQTNYQPAIATGANNAMQGFGEFNSNLAAQQNLANQLQNNAAGLGPNPAQAQFNQNTGQNVEQQAALMAGQRGSGANAGLIAREAGQQGGAIQQNAAGQAATLQAQQQLAAQGELAKQQQAIQAGITGEQGANTNLLQAGAAAQNTQNQGNINNYQMVQGINSGVAQNNANATNATQTGALNAAGAALAGYANAGNSNQNAGGYQPIYDGSPTDNGGAGYTGGATQGGSIGIMGGTGGGMPTSAKGGMVGQGKMLHANKKIDQVPQKDRMLLPTHLNGMADIFHPKFYALGGPVDVVSQAPSVYDAIGNAFKQGGQVPGKAKVKGDSLKNDTVPIIASPGEVVIPRSIMESKDPGEGAKKFVNNLHSKYPQGGEEDDFKSALSRAIKGRKSK